MDVYVIEAENEYEASVILGVCSSLEIAQKKTADWYHVRAEERRDRYQQAGWTVIAELGDWVLLDDEETYWVSLGGWSGFDNLAIYRMKIDADLDND